jgi:peptidoglycan/LPS O-acetylase OafA/YrhL
VPHFNRCSFQLSHTTSLKSSTMLTTSTSEPYTDDPITANRPVDAEVGSSTLSFASDLRRERHRYNVLVRIIWTLLPTYIQTFIKHIRRQPKYSQPLVIRKTSFLDGLRGVAALIIVLFHYMSSLGYYGKPYIPVGLLENDESPMEYSSPLQLPIVRLFYAGPEMVLVFFVISGYVLSHRAVKSLRAGNLEKVIETTGSVTIRRPIRLFAPTIVAICLLQLIVWLGWPSDPHMQSEHDMFGDGLSGALNGFWNRTFAVINASFLGDSGASGVTDQFWSIPVEFVCSLVLAVLAVCMTRVPKAGSRMAIVGSLAVYCISQGRPRIFVFFMGWLIAEVEAELEDRSGQFGLSEKLSGTAAFGLKTMNTIVWSILFVVGLYLMSWSYFYEERDFFMGWLNYLAPRAYGTESGARSFWICIGATLTTWSLFRVPVLQRPFTTRVALYLGEISFSMYLTHFKVHMCVSRFAPAQANAIFGVMWRRESELGRFLCICYELGVLLFFTLWEADLFWRWVDQPTNRLARWFESKLN